MLAKRIMVTDIVSAHVDEKVDDILGRMRENRLRVVPVLEGDGKVAGVISTFTILEHTVPSYIVSGDLNQIPYAPDMGILRHHFSEISEKRASEIMDTNPLMVHEDESLLSVAASLIVYTKHEITLVVDAGQRLKGVVSAGDILDRMRNMSGEFDA